MHPHTQQTSAAAPLSTRWERRSNRGEENAILGYKIIFNLVSRDQENRKDYKEEL